MFGASRSVEGREFEVLDEAGMMWECRVLGPKCGDCLEVDHFHFVIFFRSRDDTRFLDRAGLESQYC